MTITPAARLPTFYWPYLLGLSLTGLAYSVVSIALPFIVLELRPSQPEAAVSATVLAGSLPLFFGALLGRVADRTAPRVLLSLAPLLRAVLVALVGWLTLRGDVTLPILLGLALFNGLLSGLSVAAESALLPRLVPAAQLPQANSLQSAGLMGAPLIGYGVGGALVHAVGPGQTLLLTAPLVTSLALAAAFLPRLPAAATERSSLLLDLRAGAAVLLRSPFLLGILGAGFLLNAAMNLMNVRSPLFMQQAGRGAADYAAFEMLISGGVLLGILLVAPLARRLTMNGVLSLGRWVVLAGSAALIPASVPAWWAAAAVFGVGLGLIQVSGMTRMQELVPVELRGRTTGTLLSVNAFGLSLGAALAGSGASTPTLMAGQTACLLLLAIGWPFLVRAEARRRAQGR